MILLIVCTTGVLCLYAFYNIYRKRYSTPQGLKETPLEKGLPIIGVINEIKPNLALYLTKLGQKHGPIFRFKLGMREMVVLNNYDVIKKALKDDGDNFAGRPSLKFIKHIDRNSGIVFTDGSTWSEQRSFVLKVLRDFGLGKSKAFEVVQTECLYLLEELDSLNGKVVAFSKFISIYLINVIAKFIMNKRFSKDDHKLEVIEKAINVAARSQDYIALLFMMFPFLDESALICKFILTVTSRWKMFDDVHEIGQDEIDEHLPKLDLNSEGEDLIDRFLIKQHQLKQKTGHVSTFTNWQLIRNTLELFGAGYETTSTTLGWTFMFMSKFPEVQNKVYKEITDEIGKERMPTMNDKRSLNYTQAVMDEIMRMSSVVPLSINHRNLADTSVNGYFIPKNSFIFPNLYACHFDTDVWDNPTEFNPLRFLSTDDDGRSKYSPKEELLFFGIGKRQCLGEALARMEYFIFFTSIIQKFNVRFSENVSDEKYQEILKGNNGIIRFSLETDFIFAKR